ncbi:MAG: hypothetical protein GYB67_06755 [Chloroflexi bacterium]|nr:hypothetical protein [Chloroflexota bacterium]
MLNKLWNPNHAEAWEALAVVLLVITVLLVIGPLTLERQLFAAVLSVAVIALLAVSVSKRLHEDEDKRR